MVAALLPGGRVLNVARWLAKDGEFHQQPLIENFGSIHIGPGFRLCSQPARSHLATGPSGHLDIGARVWISFGASVAAHKLISIGDDVSVAPYVAILDTDFHQLNNREVIPEGRPISIGSSVRIGTRVTILGGTTIGEGATIAAGSVVRGSIPSGAFAEGVPARVSRSGPPQ